MRIISKFKDYYDKGIAFGIDPKLIYVREEKEIDISYINRESEQYKVLYKLIGIASRIPDWDGPKGLIYFCGKSYPYYSVIDDTFVKTYYSFDALIKAVNSKSFREEVVKTKMIAKDGVRALNKIVESVNKIINANEKNIRYCYTLGYKEFDESNYGKVVSDNAFVYFNSPIIHIPIEGRGAYNEAIINPRLNKYNFISVFDPIAAYQEIAMYLGSALAKQVDPSVNFSDNMKRDIAGFDEWSFRRHRDDKK